MIWFILALISPILYALVNHIDKYLIEEYIGERSVGALVIISSLFAIFALPLILVFNPDVFDISASKALLLILNGGILGGAILCYLHGLYTEDATLVAPFAQLVPLFGMLFGYVFLGETLTLFKIIAIVLFISGGIVLSLDLKGEKPKLKTKFIILMCICTLGYAINVAIFKYVALEQNFLDSLFWNMLGKFLFGVFLFFCIKSYRNSFLSLIKKSALSKRNRKYLIGINFTNETLSITAEIIVVLVAMSAPIALVQSVGGLQPLFVLLFAWMIAKYFPTLKKPEELEKISFLQKRIGIICIVLGTFALVM